MTFASGGTLGSKQSKTANQTSIQMTTSAVAEVDTLVVVFVAVDNNQTTDGDEGAVASIVDSASNTWVKVAEFCNGQGTAQAGATISVWKSVIATQIASGGTITANLSNAASRDATAISAWKFTKAASVTVLIAGTPATLATDALDPGAITLGSLTSRAYLWIHGLAGEGPQTDAYTWDADYSQITGNGTTGSAAASNMHVRGGYRIFTGTTDTVDVTSDTADRDYAQILAALYEGNAVYQKSAAITESSTITLAKKQKRISTVTESSGVSLSKKQTRLVAVTEASVVVPVKRIRRLVSILETANVAAQVKRLYLIAANIVSSSLLSIRKKQSRSVSVQEGSVLQIQKTQRRQVTVTEASSVTTTKRQQRLTQITSAAQVTFNYLKTFKLAFSISTAPIIAAAKKQLRAFTITTSGIVSFSKQLISGGGQLYHLAFDITSAAIMAARKKQLRLVQVAAPTIVTIQKTQRRIVSLLATASVAVQKVQRRHVYITASSLIAHILNLITLALDGREAVRAAFATILTNANLDVTVYTRMPYWGAEPRSVVLTIVSGSSQRGALGLIHAAFHGLEEPYRLRADCYHDDQLECEKLADKVEQAIVESASVLASTYDIHRVRKALDVDTAPPDTMLRGSRIMMDFELYTHRTVT
jgi:hypothetical protein